MNKRMFLTILGFYFYKQEEYYEKFNLTKSCLNYNGEDITYDEYLEEFEKNFKLLQKDYMKLLQSVIDLNYWLNDKLKKDTYTIEDISNKIKEFGLELNIDGFNGDINSIEVKDDE